MFTGTRPQNPVQQIPARLIPDTSASIVEVRGDVTDLSDRVEANESELADHETRIATLEGE